MVRVLRGIGVGILGFVIAMFGMFVVMGNTTGFGGEEEFSLTYAFQEVPLWTAILLLGMLMMFLGPIYYWFLESILKKEPKTRAYEP